MNISVVGYDRGNPDHRHLMLCLLMTSCDLSACTKTWHAAKAVAVGFVFIPVHTSNKSCCLY